MKNRKLIIIFLILLLLVLFAGTAIRPNLLSTNIAMADSGTVFNVPSERYKITRTNQYPASQNYYNDFNQKFVSYEITDFNVPDMTLCKFKTSFNLGVEKGTVYSFKEEGYEYELLVSYGLVNGLYDYSIVLKNFVFLNNFRISLADYLDKGISIFVLPGIISDILNYQQIFDLVLYGKFSFNFNIEYNNQYFYNKLFGVNILRTFRDSDDVWALYDIKNKSTISFYDNDNNCFKGGTYTSLYSDCSYILNNKYSYANSYISRVYYEDSIGTDGWYKIGDISSFHCEDYLCYTYYFDFHDGNDTPFLYSGNSDGQDGLSSTLIPNGGNSFYKSANWYDIPTHLYNFLIYLLFDAPLISDVTKLLTYLIQFIVSSFKILISFFIRVNNALFISIFVGFIVLSFVFKFIFKE